MSPRALFLVFEGPDGAGKTTQLAGLAARLEARGRRVRRLVEPSAGPIGTEIRRRALHGPPLLAREELELFLADRRVNVAENVLPALARGEDVLQDRYYYSTAAYQAARPELGLGPGEVVDLHRGWAPPPDRVLLLDLSPTVGLGRVGGRGARDAFEEESRQLKVREHFLALAAAEPERFRVIDAARPPAEVAEAIWEAVAPLLEEAAP